jgi:hypothetical protein
MEKMKTKVNLKSQKQILMFQTRYPNHAWTLYVYLKVQPSHKSIGLGPKKLIWLFLSTL